jgi:hypothetical protein
MDVFRKELAMKRLVTGILGGSLVLGSLIGGASPVVAATAPKICYFENVTELRYTSSSEIYNAPTFRNSAIRSIGPTSSFPDAIAVEESSFSGDCPLDIHPTSESGPPYFYYRDAIIPGNVSITFGNFSYYENGVKKYRSPLEYALASRSILWNTTDAVPGNPTPDLYFIYQSTIYNPLLDLVEYRPVLRYGVGSSALNRSVTYYPFANDSISIWNGNAATENCDYVDELTCPGGYKFENYVIMPKNSMTVKWKALDTKISAKAGKKKGKTVTVTVNVDRQFTDVNGNDVKRYSGDKVTIMRDGKVVGTAKVKKNGVAKVKIKDIKGDNVYTVTIPETNRNWDATTTFVK